MLLLLFHSQRSEPGLPYFLSEVSLLKAAGKAAVLGTQSEDALRYHVILLTCVFLFVLF